MYKITFYWWRRKYSFWNSTNLKWVDKTKSIKYAFWM